MKYPKKFNETVTSTDPSGNYGYSIKHGSNGEQKMDSETEPRPIRSERPDPHSETPKNGVSIEELINLIETNQIVFPTIDDKTPFRDSSERYEVEEELDYIFSEYKNSNQFYPNFSKHIKDKLEEISRNTMSREDTLRILKSRVRKSGYGHVAIGENDNNVWFKPESISGVSYFDGNGEFGELKDLLLIFNNGIPVACSIIKGLLHTEISDNEVVGFGNIEDNDMYRLPSFKLLPFIYNLKKEKWTFPFCDIFFMKMKEIANAGPNHPIYDRHFRP